MDLMSLPSELLLLILESYVSLASPREIVLATRVNARFHDELRRLLICSRLLLYYGHEDPYYYYPVGLVAHAVLHDLRNELIFDPKISTGLDNALRVTRPDLEPTSEDAQPLRLALCKAFVRHHSIDIILRTLGKRRTYSIHDPHWDDSDQCHAMAAAAALGDVLALRRLLAKGTDLSKISSLFGNPLVAAATANQTAALELLFDVSLEISEAKPMYHPCLCQAAYHSATDAVGFLLSSRFAAFQRDPSVWSRASSSLVSVLPNGLNRPRVTSSNATTACFQEAFEWAAFGGDHRSCAMIYPFIDIPARRACLDLALTRACQVGRDKVVTFLLSEGAIPSMTPGRENHLTWSIQSFSPKVVRQLLRHNPAAANCTEIPLRGSPLQLACRFDDTSILHMLIDAGADLTGRASGAHAPSTVLTKAAWEGRRNAVEALIARGADLELDANGLLALCGAARAGHLSIVQHLVCDVGMDVNGIHGSGEQTRQSPLGAALSSDRGVQTAKLLREHGAVVSVWEPSSLYGA